MQVQDGRQAHVPLHVPVLLEAFLMHAGPIAGVWVDGTFGAGGYASALLEAGAEEVIGIDRDPEAVAAAGGLTDRFAGRLTVVTGRFGQMADMPEIAARRDVDGVVLDLGVSSMQLDGAHRGFSIRRDGPLDMRMSRSGRSAGDIVNGESPESLAEIFSRYGEEPAARRIARDIARERERAPIESTAQLADIVARSGNGGRRAHPATRVFQALRIAVNDELAELARGLIAAERLLREGGLLAVVSFHSLEDRMVKRFLRRENGMASRHAPARRTPNARFRLTPRRAVRPSAAEIVANPRARSARLRVAARTGETSRDLDIADLGLRPLAAAGAR